MHPPIQITNVPACPHCQWPLAMQVRALAVTTYSWICTHCNQGAVQTKVLPGVETGSVTGLPPGMKIIATTYDGVTAVKTIQWQEIVIGREFIESERLVG